MPDGSTPIPDEPTSEQPDGGSKMGGDRTKRDPSLPEAMPRLELAVPKKPKGKIKYTREWYDAFVSAYLMYPGNHSAVGRELGVTRHACRTVWNDGWKKQVGTGGLNGEKTKRKYEPIKWAPPIKEKIAEYQAMARAKLEEQRARSAEQEKKDDERLREAVDKAKRDIIDSRALQGRSIKTARANSIALMGVSGNLLQSGVDLSKKVRTLMGDPNWKPSPKQAIYLLRAMAEITKMGIESAHIADEMERRALGEPDMILGIEAHMTVDDAVKEIRDAHSALTRSEQLGGGLRVVPDPSPDPAATG